MYSFIYLASNSSRRKDLLSQMGIAYENLGANVSHLKQEVLEKFYIEDTPEIYVKRCSMAKGIAAALFLFCYILDANTINTANNNHANKIDQLLRNKPFKLGKLIKYYNDRNHVGISFNENSVFKNYFAPILSADTVVVSDNQIIGKPSDLKHAFNILKQLSGRSHHVLTAVTLISHCDQKAILSKEGLEFENITFHSKNNGIFEQVVAQVLNAYSISVNDQNKLNCDYQNLIQILPISLQKNATCYLKIAHPLFPILKMTTIVSSSSVCFARLDNEDINRYLANNEALDKAGAYGIQGKAANFITQISGSYSSIMGLPIYETGQLLKNAKVLFN